MKSSLFVGQNQTRKQYASMQMFLNTKNTQYTVSYLLK